MTGDTSPFNAIAAGEISRERHVVFLPYNPYPRPEGSTHTFATIVNTAVTVVVCALD